MNRTRAEQETIIRWDEEDQRVDIYTASRFVAERLLKRGYPLEEIKTSKGEVTGWRWLGPSDCLTFRTLVDGVVPKHASNPDGLARWRRANELGVREE